MHSYIRNLSRDQDEDEDTPVVYFKARPVNLWITERPNLNSNAMVATIKISTFLF